MKLITKEIEEKMKKYPYGSQDGKTPEEIEVIVKFFNPGGPGTWIATEVCEKTNDDTIFYGVAELGYGYEWDTFSLKELESLKLPYGLTIERDLYCGNKLSSLLSRADLTDLGFYEEEQLKDKYMLLDRLKQDCEYYLGNGNRNSKHLWAGSPEEQISKMREIYDSFEDKDKPEWLSKEEIDSYERQMVVDKNVEKDSEIEM